MSSTKVFLCDLCIILLYGITVILAEDGTTSSLPTSEVPSGNCSCGGFPVTTPKVEDAPLLSQSPGLVVKCNEEGANTCKALCTALATATKAKGPEILCAKLKDADELKLSAFYKLCDKPWVYADMTADEPLCCDNSKMKTCASAEKTNTTVVAEAKPVI